MMSKFTERNRKDLIRNRVIVPELTEIEKLQKRITKLEKFIDELAGDNDLSPLTDWLRGFNE